MPSLSIIIPTFNAEKYLVETLDSILHQTFQDWELIVVDDCSTDQTQAIIQQYIAKDERISLIKMPTNTGSSRLPVREGVRNSISPYVSWVAQDDILDYNYFEKLMHRIINSDADVVCSIMIPNNISYPIIPSPDFDLEQILCGVDACILTLAGWKINANGWVVKRPLFLQTLNENDDHYMNSDEVDTRKVLFDSHKVAFTDAHYNYRIHSESISHKISPKFYERLITNNQLYEFTQKNILPRHKEIIDTLALECVDTLLEYKNIFLRKKSSYSKYQRKIISTIFKKAHRGMRLNNISTKKIKLFLVLHSFYIFQTYTFIKFQIEKHKYE